MLKFSLAVVSAVLFSTLATGVVHAADGYRQALEKARRAGRPLLLVLENPEEPTAQLEQIATDPAKSQRSLLAPYQVCRVDVRTPQGKKLAEKHRAKSFPTTVILDKTGSARLFRKSGAFTNEEWRATLNTYQHGLRRPTASAAVSGSRDLAG